MNAIFLNPALQLEPDGPLWQLLTCHFTHWTYEQLAWDAVAFLALGAACARRNRAAFHATLLASAILVPLAVLAFAPEVIAYRGLSGLDSALFVLLVLECGGGSHRSWLRQRSWRFAIESGGYAAALLGFIAKIAFEMHTGATVFAGSVTPVPVAHIAGAVSALLVAAVYTRRTCVSSWPCSSH
jgi:membrane associated rhomboid family serine protease